MKKEIKKIYKYIKQIILLSFYNKKYKTKILSTKASLRANYGIGTLISENSIVTEDVSIGMNSYINQNSSVENCIIGNYCSISSGVYINPIEHDLNKLSTHPFIKNKSSTNRKKVNIGHDVLISLNVIILEGTNIGTGAVIAAGAVVTKDVQPYEIVGGVPAKHIGWRFTESERIKILESNWWVHEPEYIRNKTDLYNFSTEQIIKEKKIDT